MFFPIRKSAFFRAFFPSDYPGLGAGLLLFIIPWWRNSWPHVYAALSKWDDPVPKKKKKYGNIMRVANVWLNQVESVWKILWEYQCMYDVPSGYLT
jgi:hypothetical protein